MRHKYKARALVLSRTPLGEANVLLTLVTPEIGLVRARAQGLRRPGARLSAALATLAESDVSLVRGAQGWRVTGAELVRHWSRELPYSSRERVGRVASLLMRLVPAEAADEVPFHALMKALASFASEGESMHEAIECRAVLELLAALGLDEGVPPALEEVEKSRAPFIARINRGIALSGL